MNAKNGKLQIENTYMDYIVFGSGTKNLIMIPGVGDGLKTVAGTAIPFAVMYHQLAREYKVYAFSRRNDLPQGFSTRNMAEDIYSAIKQLNIESAHILGVSQGGMIAQWLAIDHPDTVEKLTLAVTMARQNKTVQEVIKKWISMAKQGDYKGIMMDTAEKSYSESYLKKARWMYGIISRVTKPKSFERFLIQASSCLTHDTYDQLDKITCPVLVIGGRQDKIVTGKASEEIAERIPGSRLHMYEEYGHGAYEEAKDFIAQVMKFGAES